MSYDIRIKVKVEGCDKYVNVGVPEFDSPTYNLRNMFVACMGWDYKQGEHYPAKEVLGKLEKGIEELAVRPENYEQYNPENGWGSIDSAIEALRSARKCIRCCAEEFDDTDLDISKYPLECLYFKW